MNVFFGIGIAIILYVVVLLGIQAFYPAKMISDYNCTYPSYPSKLNMDLEGCSNSMTVGECISYRENLTITYDKEMEEYDSCYQKFNDAQKVYNKNFFLITNLLGVALIVVASLFIVMTNISAGVSFAGLGLIVWGFARGWDSIGNSTKFVVALIIAALIIWLGVRFNTKQNKKQTKKRN